MVGLRQESSQRPQALSSVLPRTAFNNSFKFSALSITIDLDVCKIMWNVLSRDLEKNALFVADFGNPI